MTHTHTHTASQARVYVQTSLVSTRAMARRTCAHARTHGTARLQGSLEVWNGTSYASVVAQRRHAAALGAADEQLASLKERVHHVSAQARMGVCVRVGVCLRACVRACVRARAGLVL
jgi:hypothetical protein